MRTTVLLVVATVAVVLVVVWPSRAVGGLHVSLREATDVEADEHTDLTGEGFVLLVAEIGNTSRQTIYGVRVAVPDHLPIHAAVADAPNRDVTHLANSELLWPVQQLATSQVGWDAGWLDPGEQATVYLAVEAAYIREAAVRAAASGVAPVTVDLDGATLVTIPTDTGLHAGVDREQTEDAPSDPTHLDNDDQATDPPDTVAAGHASPGHDWQRLELDEDALGGENQQHMHSVAAGGPGLVAVGSVLHPNREYSGAVWTSADGVAWERIEDDEAVFGGDGSQRMRSVTTGGPGMVAVGYDSGRGSAAVWTSTDGLDWQRVEHDPTVFGDDSQSDASLRMTAVTAGGPGLVAVGFETALEDNIRVGAAAVWTSVDGLTWQRVEHDEQVFSGERRQGMASVVAGGPGVVAVGWDESWATGPEVVAGGYPAVWTSTDGLAWQRVEHDPTVFGTDDSLIVRSVSAGGPGLVAVGGDEAREEAAVWTSTDGLTWRRVEPDQTVFAGEDWPMMRSVTIGGPGLVAVGHHGRLGRKSAAVWTSADGLSWQRAEHDQAVFGEFSSRMLSVTAGGPGLVAVGYQTQLWSAVVWTSP